MHEITIANKIIREAKKQGAKNSIKIEIGELSEITPSELKPVLRKLTNWNIEVNYKKSKVKCGCGYEGKARIIDRGHGYCVFNCPQCDGKPEVVEGGEIKIIGIE